MSKFANLDSPPILSSRTVRVGIVGTGYIADFHALGIRGAEGVELVSVCDANVNSAQSFAENWQVSSVHNSLESMLGSERLDAVHILTPADSHDSLARNALRAGTHVFLEKPMCVSTEQADQLCTLASDNGLKLGVNHNMLYASAYQRLRDLVHSRALGSLTHVVINHFAELGQIRFGPFSSWMLRSPENPFLEVGPHLISMLLDLVGKPTDINVEADRKINLPGGGRVYRRWRVRAAVGNVAVDINVNFGPGFPQRTLNVRGLFGSASVDIDANTCTFDQSTSLGPDFDRYQRSRTQARQIQSQAQKTISDYLLTVLKLRRRGNPYQVTFVDSVAAFYVALKTNTQLDSRISGESARDVVECCSLIVKAAGVASVTSTDKPALGCRDQSVVRPTVLVFGGTGFIGRELIRQLLDAQYSVRVAVRSSGAVLDDFDKERIELVRGDLHSESDLRVMMSGIEFVYHLAVDSAAKSWDDHLRQNVEPTRLIGEACLAAGIKRLIYTGTIDSYYAGAGAGVITETTPLDPHINRRNYYARAKAAGEAILLEMHRTRHLPLVVFRPGIVIGRGGNPFHYGVGRWPAPSVCEVWGSGNNKLPFVLVSDVAAALLRGIQISGIDGRSYNLVDDPVLSAREYLGDLQKRVGASFSILHRPIWRLYLNDLAKWLVKLVVRHRDRNRIPSYSDWESRTQKAHFDNKGARTELGWLPASSRQRMLDEGIGGSLQSWLAACE